ncbi:MAG: pilus assembly protein PilM [Sedimentisphaerales bacterium]|nr:pilus assembly protein PilM [Sedimentisphaerales bacterium]
MRSTQTVLGLAIDESGIAAAALRARAGRHEIRRCARFVFRDKLSPENAEELGRQLKQFLRANHFTAKQAAVGIPAQWIVAKEITVPPAKADSLSGLLHIQAERTFSLNAGDLVFDYCGRPSSAESSRILLLATRRQLTDQIVALVTAAGLRVQSVTVSALSLNEALPRDTAECRYGLYARPGYCEFWSRANGRLRSIQHVSTPADATALAATIQRLLVLSSKQDPSSANHVTVYDDGGLSEGTFDRLRDRLAPGIAVADGNAALFSDRLGAALPAVEAQSIAAVAVAMGAAGADRPPVDFLHSRINGKKVTGHKRLTVWAAIVAVACLIGLGSVLAGWRSDTASIAYYTEQLELMSEDLAAARELVDRVSYARSWTSREPEFLECLRELTLAFPQEPRIWATNLALSDNGVGALIGKAVDKESFYEVLDLIKNNEAFSDVQMVHVRDAGRDSREQEFAVNFIFRGAK